MRNGWAGNMDTENNLNKQKKTAESLPKREIVVNLRGVPKKIFQRGYDDTFIGTISHEYRLVAKATQTKHSILEEEADQLHCTAFVVPPNTLIFSYQTKGFLGEKGDRHPDMFAADLATAQYKYLLDQGNTIERFQAQWKAEGTMSENYEDFLNYYREQIGSVPRTSDLTGSPIATEAAWQTMSGRLARKLGFGQITSILFDPNDSIYVSFKKTENIEIVVEESLAT